MILRSLLIVAIPYTESETEFDDTTPSHSTMRKQCINRKSETCVSRTLNTTPSHMRWHTTPSHSTTCVECEWVVSLHLDECKRVVSYIQSLRPILKTRVLHIWSNVEEWCRLIRSNVKKSCRTYGVWDRIWRHDSFLIRHIRSNVKKSCRHVWSNVNKLCYIYGVWDRIWRHDALIFDTHVSSVQESGVVTFVRMPRSRVVYTECKTEFDDMTPSHDLFTFDYMSNAKESCRIYRVWDRIWWHDSFTWLLHMTPSFSTTCEEVVSSNPVRFQEDVSYIRNMRPNLTTRHLHIWHNASNTKESCRHIWSNVKEFCRIYGVWDWISRHESFVFDRMCRMWRSCVVKFSQISRRFVVYTEFETEFDDTTPSHLTECVGCEGVMPSRSVERERVVSYIRSLRPNLTTWILHIRPYVSDVKESCHEYRVWDFLVIHCWASGKVVCHVEESYIYIYIYI